MEDVKNYKSFLIIRELLEKIYKIDDYQFPNDDAKKAKSLLINILKAVLSVPSNYEIDEESLFNFVTNLDLIIFHLENCNTNKLNWAIVGYSDDLLESFNNIEACIIYSRYIGHTYFIYELTQTLESILKPVLDREKRASLLDKDHNSNIWCFCLSSVDENNITTFANIAHEIGHIIFKKEKDDILIIRDQVLQEKIDIKFANRARKLLKEYPKEKRLYINSVSTQLLFSLIEETCADVVGAILLGPTFLLSLNEFTWDVIGRKSENIWFIELEKERLNYPSMAFRKKCIKSLINYNSFLKSMKKISSLNKIDEMIDKYLKSETIETDRFLIKYDEELEKYLNNFISEISDAFLLFAHRVYDYIINKYKIEIKEPDYKKIDDLIKRLSNKIPPNIVNDGTLLGQIANYSEILLSSYLSKIYTFYRSDGMNQEKKIKDLSIINKLTTKAIECTYMQKEYLKEKNKTIK